MCLVHSESKHQYICINPREGCGMCLTHNFSLKDLIFVSIPERGEGCVAKKKGVNQMTEYQSPRGVWDVSFAEFFSDNLRSINP